MGGSNSPNQTKKKSHNIYKTQRNTFTTMAEEADTKEDSSGIFGSWMAGWDGCLGSAAFDEVCGGGNWARGSNEQEHVRPVVQQTDSGVTRSRSPAVTENPHAIRPVIQQVDSGVIGSRSPVVTENLDVAKA